jgi:hypothetical protein
MHNNWKPRPAMVWQEHKGIEPNAIPHGYHRLKTPGGRRPPVQGNVTAIGLLILCLHVALPDIAI